MWFLAFRHIFARRNQSLLTLAAVVLGCGGYVVFTSIQMGFQEYMKERLIKRGGHITISARDEYITEESVKGIFFDGAPVSWINPPAGRRARGELKTAALWESRLRELPEVEASAPEFSESFTISKGAFFRTVSIKGIIPERHHIVTGIGDDVSEGGLSLITQGTGSIIAGSALIKFLGARVNDTVNVVNAKGNVFPVKIAAVYDSGDMRSDERTVLASIITVQKLAEMPGRVSKIIVNIKDPEKAAARATRWSALSSDKVESWDQASRNFLSMIETQNYVRYFTTAIFITIVSFGIYNILNMVVAQKKKDIAILRSIGYTRSDTVFLFLIQGVVVGLAGAFAGLVFSYGICLLIEMMPAPENPRAAFMVSWDPMIYLTGFVLVTLSSVISSVFPAVAAGRLSPIDIIRGSG
jgi:lipoprotein-releasing system permease protein